MHRIDHETRAQNGNGLGKDGFTEGDPARGVAATIVTDAFLNDVQESIAVAVEGEAITLQKGNPNQLLQAIRHALGDAAMRNWRELDAQPATICRAITTLSSGRIIAVGDDGNTYWADDEISWTLAATAGGYSARLNDIAARSVFSGFGGLAIEAYAVGEAGEIQRSTDGGASWTSVHGIGDDLHAIHAEASLLVAVGLTGTILTSGDGSTWTTRTPGGTYTGAFRGVAKGGRTTTEGDTLIAVGTGGEVQRSTDNGVTWTAVGGVTLSDLYAVTYLRHEDIWVAAGSDLIVSRDNGETWLRVGLKSGETILKMKAANGRIMAVGTLAVGGGTAVASWVSRDGTGFARATTGVGGADGCTYTGDRWILCGDNSGGGSLFRSTLRDWPG